MAYIGKSPAVGNFVKLDAISTSSTNTYNLTVDSVAFVPESANHMLVSLNGVIQAPLSSFSVSGSTITFIPASGTLSSSDSIDFIMVYGNVLDIGTPSDSTVTNAKTNFVSTSSNAGLQIKGDNTTAGTLQLNCEQNSHGIKLRSPPHSASASYTLTFPTTDGSADEFLKTDGSGVLSWATAGGTNTPAFNVKTSTGQSIANGTSTEIVFGTENFDTDNAFASNTFTVPSGKAGKYFLFAQAGRQAWDSDRFMLQMQKTPSGGSTVDIGVGESAINVNKYHTTGVWAVVDLAVGDAIKIMIYHDSGATRTLSSDERTVFQGFKLL